MLLPDLKQKLQITTMTNERYSDSPNTIQYNAMTTVPVKLRQIARGMCHKGSTQATDIKANIPTKLQKYIQIQSG